MVRGTLHECAWIRVELGDAAGSAGLAAGGTRYRCRHAYRPRPTGQWRLWMAPSHAHMLFCWVVSSIRRWRRLLHAAPRDRRRGRLATGERTAALAVVALNLGLVLRIVAEPVERTGGESPATLALLGASALLQLAAALVSWPSCGLVLVLARYARRESKQRDRSRSGIER